MLGLQVAFRDPGVKTFGLENVVMPCGDQFVEVVSPVEDGTTAGRLLEKRFGDGGYMIIFQTDSLDWVRNRSKDLDMRIVFEATSTADHGPTSLEGIHLHPSDTGGTLLSIDAAGATDEGGDATDWAWAGPEWRNHIDTSVVDAIVGLEIQSNDPDDVAQRWSALLERPVEDGLLELDDADLRFVKAADGRGDGLRSIDFRVKDRDRVGEQLIIHGVIVNLR